ncbi:hypothetical protein [Streptomyces sp. NPDC005859]|uniref:hypothetical protein n=1 Tax=Streptomyces sp. NPDC005859 TaxID=3157170 RepID=UPI003411CBDF
MAINVPSPVIPNARKLGVAAAAEPLLGTPSISAVLVTRAAPAAAILFPVEDFIGFSLPFERAE